MMHIEHSIHIYNSEKLAWADAYTRIGTLTTPKENDVAIELFQFICSSTSDLQANYYIL